MTPARRALIAPGLAAVAAAAVCSGLGLWQVQRLHWKQALIATVEARTRFAPITAPSLAAAAATAPADLDYRPVAVTGRWLADREAHVHAVLGEPRGRFGGLGVWVMTPIERADGSIVWIDRGFVPVERADPATRPAPLPEGEVTVTGLMRPPEPRSWVTPADDLVHRLWFVRDPAALARGVGLDPARVAAFTVDAFAALTPPGGLPQAGETKLTFRDDHLGYAITWFGLAAAAIGVFAVFARRRLRPA